MSGPFAKSQRFFGAIEPLIVLLLALVEMTVSTVSLTNVCTQQLLTWIQHHLHGAGWTRKLSLLNGLKLFRKAPTRDRWIVAVWLQQISCSSGTLGGLCPTWKCFWGHLLLQSSHTSWKPASLMSSIKWSFWLRRWNGGRRIPKGAGFLFPNVLAYINSIFA